MLEIRTQTASLAAAGGHGVDAQERARRPVLNEKPLSAATREDQVELSRAGKAFEAPKLDMPARIARIREMIEKNEYLTDDKLDIVVNRLHGELFGPTRKAS